MTDRNRFVLNDWGRFRTGGRASIEVRASPITVDTDPLRIGKPIAEAITAEVRDGIKSQGGASTGTILARKYAANAWSKGKSWARERYPSGPPTVSDRLLHASGHLAKGLKLTTERDTFAVRAPAGRLTEPGVRARVLQILRPTLARAMASRRVLIAKRAALRGMVTVGRAR